MGGRGGRGRHRQVERVPDGPDGAAGGAGDQRRTRSRAHRGIVACPNCTTIVTVMPLKPLHDVGRLRRVVATSYQAVSGAGVNGVEELREQTLAWARGRGRSSPGTSRTRSPSTSSRTSTRSRTDGYTGEEMKLVNETRKILELPDLSISPDHGAGARVHRALDRRQRGDRGAGRASRRRARAFAAFPGLRVWDDPAQRPATRCRSLVEGQDDCFVGRIRQDLSHPNAPQLLGGGRPAPQGRRPQRDPDRRAARRLMEAGDRRCHASGDMPGAGTRRLVPAGRVARAAQYPAHPGLRRRRLPRLANPAGGSHHPGRADRRVRARARAAGPGGGGESHRRRRARPAARWRACGRHLRCRRRPLAAR